MWCSGTAWIIYPRSTRPGETPDCPSAKGETPSQGERACVSEFVSGDLIAWVGIRLDVSVKERTKSVEVVWL